MMQTERLKTIIAEALPCEALRVDGDGQHFEALIVSDRFVGLNRVCRQQVVNTVLRPYFDSGELHALSMKTLTSDEWSESRG